jgi:hypothetical protein
MVQEIITYLILGVTVAILVRNALRFFKAPAEQSRSGKCAGCSGACEIRGFQKFDQPKILKPEHYRLKL